MRGDRAQNIARNRDMGDDTRIAARASFRDNGSDNAEAMPTATIDVTLLEAVSALELTLLRGGSAAALRRAAQHEREQT